MKLSGKTKTGMTLVELMVVLTILAGIATTVAIYSSASLDGALADKTRRESEAMRKALTREDGLNLARDIGRMPDPSQPGELSLLASRIFRKDVKRLDSLAAGPLDASSDASLGVLRAAPLFRRYSLFELKDSVTNTAASAVKSELDALVAVPAISNLWRSASIGAGWRGPYCLASEYDGSGEKPTLLMRDPFGGFWDFAESGAMRVLACYGQDRLLDSDALADTNDWRNLDHILAVCTTNDTGTLRIEAEFLSGSDVSSATNTVHAYCFAPRLNADNLESDGITCKMTPATCIYTNMNVSAAGGSLELHGLSQGTWAVFLYAGISGAHFSAPVRTVQIGLGFSSLKFILYRQ